MPRLLPAAEPGIYLPTALDVLRHSGVVALPTETVYGLAASLLSPAGVGRVFSLKGRPAGRALPLQFPSLEAAEAFGFRFSSGGLRLARRFWPGPLTLVVERPPATPSWFAPKEGAIAVRVPDHPVAQALLRAFGFPLAVTSANSSGGPPALEARTVREMFPAADDLLVLDGGRSHGGEASSVVDARGAKPFLLRRGPVSWKAVEEAWNA